MGVPGNASTLTLEVPLNASAPVLLDGRFTVTLTAVELADASLRQSADALQFPPRLSAGNTTLVLQPPLEACAGVVSFASLFARVAEPSDAAGPARLDLAVNRASGTYGRAVFPVALAATPTDASLVQANVSFAHGQAGPQTVSVLVLPDRDPELDENITVALQPATIGIASLHPTASQSRILVWAKNKK